MKTKHKIIICIIVLLILTGVWFCIPYSPLKAEFENDTVELIEENSVFESDEVFSESEFEDYPLAIRKYIENCGYIGTRKMNYVKMEYSDVAFSQGRSGPNLIIDYTQYDFVAHPSRMAMIESSMFGIPFQGYDQYRGGKGGMWGVVAKLIPIFDQTGEDMDRACLATFLAECMFVPTSFLQDYIKFEEINEFQVKSTIDAYGQTVSGIFTFNNDYEMISFCTSDRAVVGADGTIEHIPWSAVCGDYKVGNDGIHRPSTFQAIWNYPDGDFVYFNGTIRSITSE